MSTLSFSSSLLHSSLSHPLHLSLSPSLPLSLLSSLSFSVFCPFVLVFLQAAFRLNIDSARFFTTHVALGGPRGLLKSMKDSFILAQCVLWLSLFLGGKLHAEKVQSPFSDSVRFRRHHSPPDQETAHMVVVRNPANLPQVPHVENVKLIVCDNCREILAE